MLLEGKIDDDRVERLRVPIRFYYESECGKDLFSLLNFLIL